MNQLTPIDIQNILALISKAPITGAEAITVGVLQQKLTAMMNAPEAAKDGATCPAT